YVDFEAALVVEVDVVALADAEVGRRVRRDGAAVGGVLAADRDVEGLRADADLDSAPRLGNEVLEVDLRQRRGRAWRLLRTALEPHAGDLAGRRRRCAVVPERGI